MAQFSFIRAGACIRDRMKYRSLIRTGAFMRHVVTAPATSHAGPPPPSQGMSEALSSGERSDNPRESGQLAGYRPSIRADALASVSTPIFQTATFDVSAQGSYDYTRSGNPTRESLEALCARIENAYGAFAFNSGMAALGSVLGLLKPGDTVIASRDIYGGMHRLLRHREVHCGLKVIFVETWDLPAVTRAVESCALGSFRMLCVESPTNPMMRISDLRALASIAHNQGALMCVDNSIMSPVLAQPLTLGADIVVHSATKFLSGHSDTMAGVVAVKDAEVARRIGFMQNADGTALAPFDAWLVLRGMKTMALRMAAAQANAIELAEQLRQHPVVSAVHYLTGEDSAEARLHFSQARGGGAVLSFETGDVAASKAFIRAAAAARGGLFRQTVSFGSVSSLVELPAEMSHASIPEAERDGVLPPDLVRMSVGIEDASDLSRALGEALAAAQSVNPRGVLPNHLFQQTSQRKIKEPAGAGSGALPFGVSLPQNDPNAVGVSMPSWKDVIAYEEGCPVAQGKLQSGYPRFVFLKSVQKLFATAEKLFGKPGETAMALPSARVALRLQKFMLAAGCDNVNVHDFFAHGVFAVTFPQQYADVAKQYWQHCGEIVSSRLAEAVLEIVDRTCWENASRVVVDDGTAERAHANRTSKPPKGSYGSDDDQNVLGRRTSADPLDGLTRRVAALASEHAENAFIYPTGMASIAAVHRLVKLNSDWKETPLYRDRRNVVFGFPYLDTLKLNGRPELGSGVIFFGNGDEKDIAELEDILRNGERIGGLFCEFPSNPLLRAPPLSRLRALADTYGFPLIVDDSISGFCNVDVLREGGADILVSSLTKQFSGANNAMGGSLVLNSRSPHYAQLHTRLQRDYEPLLWHEDASALLSASSDVEARVAVTNANALSLVDMLREHPAVKRVYHPSCENRKEYDVWKKPHVGGYGALLSVVFHDDANARKFYDSLDTAKGPGFGSNFTLVCPYTMIAHFNELEWCRDFGVDPSLIRVWVGLEEQTALAETFAHALAQTEGF